MLMESETTKLKERDEKHQAQLEAWKAELVPRKKVRHARVTHAWWVSYFYLFRVSEICKKEKACKMLICKKEMGNDMY